MTVRGSIGRIAVAAALCAAIPAPAAAAGGSSPGTAVLKEKAEKKTIKA